MKRRIPHHCHPRDKDAKSLDHKNVIKMKEIVTSKVSTNSTFVS